MLKNIMLLLKFHSELLIVVCEQSNNFFFVKFSLSKNNHNENVLTPSMFMFEAKITQKSSLIIFSSPEY